MIADLCEFKPISKSEFLEVIPPYLRSATSTAHGKYLEKVLKLQTYLDRPSKRGDELGRRRESSH